MCVTWLSSCCNCFLMPVQMVVFGAVATLRATSGHVLSLDFSDFSRHQGDDRDVPVNVQSHECRSSVLRWFNRVLMKESLPLDIVISVVSARTCVRASTWFELTVVLDLRCSVVLLFTSPRTSHLVVWLHNHWLRGRAHAPHSMFKWSPPYPSHSSLLTF